MEKFDELFDDFLNESVGFQEQANEEYIKKANSFFETFGENIPREMIPGSISTKKIIDAIDICIESKNPDILSVLKIYVSSEVLY